MRPRWSCALTNAQVDLPKRERQPLGGTPGAGGESDTPARGPQGLLCGVFADRGRVFPGAREDATDARFRCMT